MVKFFKLWVPVFVWAGVIFFFSSVPDLKSGLEQDFIFRKAAHVTEYFVLTLLLYRAFRGSSKLSIAQLLVYSALFSFFYAISDEIHQLFVIGRQCSPWDVLIDSLGIVFSLLFLKIKKGKCSCSTK